MLDNFPDRCIHELFEFQVERSPDAIAVIFEGKQLTYQDLNSQANQLAHYLKTVGVGPEVLVAACVERSLEMVVGLLGILKAGGAYVPLDPHYPANRLAFMLEHSQTPVLLTQQHLVESLPSHQARVICLDGNLETVDRSREENPDSGVTSDNLAYVIYTSGSTGQPKGVAIEHRGAVNTLLDINQRFEVGAGDRVLALSSLSFDLSVYDIFGLLAAGGTVVIPQVSATPDPAHWVDLIVQAQVTIWNSAPALMQMLVDYAAVHSKDLSSSLRLVLLSGDWIPLTLPDQIKNLVSRWVSESLDLDIEPQLSRAGVQPGQCLDSSSQLDESLIPAVIGLGGATEASIWSILYPIETIDPTWKSIPYGGSMTNQHFYVLDEAMEPCQEGVVGELYIGGIGLARCYWRDEEKTSKRFITHPHTGDRLYCTGDLGSYLPDGNIEFIGRIDHQVKIRGFRIELGEIEAVLGQHPDVQVAVVAAQEDVPGQKRSIAAYVVSKVTAERIPFKSECLAEFDGDRSVKLETEDISISGIGAIGVPDNWSKGKRLHLRLVLPGDTEERCFEGTVAWCQGNQAGIELSLTASEKAVIQQSMDYLLETQGFLKFLQRTTAGKLRNFLKDKLPDYMVPSSFVFLKTMPLTPNGKIDRQKLLAPAIKIPELGQDYVAPQTPVEDVVAGIWAEVLGLERVGIRDNFLELGGHSLVVTQIATRIRDTFQVELPLRTLFESATVADLARNLEIASQKSPTPQPSSIQPISRHRDLPLSFSQQQLWFLCQLAPDLPFYNEPITIRLPGSVNIAALERSINEIIKRHEILRTTFAVVDGQPVMVIQDAFNFILPVVNIGELPEAERESEALRLGTLEAQQPFDLTQGPLLRGTLMRLGEADYRLFLTIHHIAIDGVSLYSLFMKELATLYSAFSLGGRSPLPELPVQFADFAYWQRQWLQPEVLENQLRYWKQQLANLSTLQLPTDRSRSPIQTFRGARQCLALPQTLSEAIAKLSQKEGVTLYMTLLAAFKTLLYRYTGQTDIVVGTVTAGRNQPEIQQLIGCFVNTLVLRTDFKDNPTFRQLLERMREVTLEAFACQDVPFEKLVEALQPERNLGQNPLFQVAFVLQPPMSGVNSILNWSQLDIDTETAKFDLTLELQETSEGIVGRFEYSIDLFNADTIDRMVGHFQTLLEGIVSNPEQKISELPLLTEWERQQLVAWNNTATDYPQNACIHQLFEEQVERSPDAIALVFEDQQLTYKELNQRANQLAHYLGKLGVTAEVMVGICVERSLEMVVGLLGILKAGGAYVPLDPAYPPERLALMLEDAQVPVLLTQRRLVESLPKHQARVVCLDTDWEIIERQSEENPECSLTSENLAYVIYTSGSTGKPKGVLVGHRGLCNLAIAQIQIFDVQPNSRVLQFASLSFDVATSDWVIALCSGATLCIAINNALLAGSDLIEVLRDRAITHIELPVAVLGVVPFEELSTLQTIIVGGETVSVDVVAKWAPGRRFFNAYGPTESTVCATIAECTDSQEPPSIGRPIANTQVYLLDAHLQLMPIGIPGEIYIGGAGLARGYLNRPELTAERFIPNPFSNEPGSRLYKTGDLARYLPDGNIEFLGRIDHQVKIRGFRIELGEIEAVLSQHPDVQESLVISRSDVSGNQRLVAYIISNLGLEHTDFGSWRNFLKQKLPDYMVPSSFVFLPNFPLTPNGKVDRKALPEPEAINPELSATYVAPQTEIEQNIATVWQQLLHLEKVGVDDNFFDLGGHSLLMAQAHSQLREVVDRDVSIVEMFKYPTIRSLAKYLSEEPEEQSSVGSSQERIKKQKDAMNRQKQKQALKGKNKNR
ncbi:MULTISPECIES: non-ribosomal peptide synthetase [unclassified Microcoleus]|uniref:non-ribosomal peptide synthetase n=1 Tax=unclassified Microcoleus TaxID=2642155 RepID=UPI001D9B6E45|nr:MULTISPECIES: non-ribosomal peptide synthetase [unclassified Microcoleus]MCC3597906.1 amino acid adenylation domain-containing protein [Microcoleus sp. PH2017_26_ELK_O_A]MCC3622892.1 amino acid adenylation domain-containing protein [Microcoleus sp. PH2017_36_ELK_O_B]